MTPLVVSKTLTTDNGDAQAVLVKMIEAVRGLGLSAAA
jgi:hypothetical protein